MLVRLAIWLLKQSGYQICRIPWFADEELLSLGFRRKLGYKIAIID